MALSDDQRALLRLLAKREDGYEDIAALKGLSVDQVRAEVNDALAELQAAGEPPPPVAEQAPESEPKPAPVEMDDPAPPPPSPSVKREAHSRAPHVARPALPAERRRLVLLTGGALAIVAAVLIAIAVFGGGSDSSSTASSDSGIEAATVTENSKVTQAVLEPADGSDAAGNAVFGKLGKEEIVLQVTAEGLEPSEKGESYTVWLYRSPKLALRVGSVPVGESGRLGARFTIPAELLAYVASGAFDRIYVSRTSDAAYRQEVAQARRNKSLPQYTGETVLAGEITGPIAKAGKEGG
ncbi:MAG TPA: hypothetical protein VF085_12100 [Solirubrobacterales bacterium]